MTGLFPADWSWFDDSWIIAGFDDLCFYGDMIVPGDTVRRDSLEGWKHQDCERAGAPVRALP